MISQASESRPAPPAGESGPYGPTRVHQQRPARAVAGAPAAAVFVAAVAGAAALIAVGSQGPRALIGVGALLLVLSMLGWFGFLVVQPNQSRVLVPFGRYVGTVLEPGLWWVNPFTALWRTTVTLRVRNFQSERLKVNDASGNPIEIAAIVVWRVVDTARAVLDVESFEEFVRLQTESAVRHLASSYPYDDYAPEVTSLRAHADEVGATLHRELQERLGVAGVQVLETRLAHLAYAPEVAEVMLRRQQAEAIVAARKTMVAGAVGLVEMALRRLNEIDLVDLDPERKAAMVSNLMVVLSGDHAPTPVINTGTLYT